MSHLCHRIWLNCCCINCKIDAKRKEPFINTLKRYTQLLFEIWDFRYSNKQLITKYLKLLMECDFSTIQMQNMTQTLTVMLPLYRSDKATTTGYGARGRVVKCMPSSHLPFIQKVRIPPGTLDTFTRQAIQLAFDTSMILLRCPLVPEIMHTGTLAIWHFNLIWKATLRR
jgi:hypothetical protein